MWLKEGFGDSAGRSNKGKQNVTLMGLSKVCDQEILECVCVCARRIKKEKKRHKGQKVNGAKYDVSEGHGVAEGT